MPQALLWFFTFFVSRRRFLGARRAFALAPPKTPQRKCCRSDAAVFAFLPACAEGARLRKPKPLAFGKTRPSQKALLRRRAKACGGTPPSTPLLTLTVTMACCSECYGDHDTTTMLLGPQTCLCHCPTLPAVTTSCIHVRCLLAQCRTQVCTSRTPAQVPPWSYGATSLCHVHQQ